MTNCVEIKNLTKKFGTNKAIDNLSVNIEEGKIIGLIGADGAGKTTLIRLIIGLLGYEEGDVSTLGLNPNSQKSQINSKIGYMPQRFGLYEDLTVLENLVLWAELKGVEHNFDELLEFTSLKNFQDRLAGKLSGGMKQKLGLACSLLGSPEFLLLDEPSVGVDPISRRELIKMVKSLSGDGTTILWSTAYLDEAFNFDTTIVMNEGKIIYQGAPMALSTTTQGFEAKVIELMGGYKKEDSHVADNFVLPEIEVDYTIEALDLVKKYGDFYAVKNNTFHIKKGEIFGLLGPNGAGKSTSFKMMCGLSSPTSGTAKIMGVDVVENPTKARSYLGYMAQKFSLYSQLSVYQNLEFYSGVYGLSGKVQQEKIEQMVRDFNFETCLNQNSGELPLGYKQRLAMACALMHTPPVLFLDEPTSGVDPLTRAWFWTHIRALAAKGVTVMVTTHFMDEAEYCDRISLFYHGEAIAVGTPSELKKSVGAKDMEEAFISLIEKSERGEK